MGRPKKAAATPIADGGPPKDDTTGEEVGRLGAALLDSEQAAATGGIAPSAIEMVPFALLRRAQENVRKTDRAADVESLADDIAAHGLLQSLIGYRKADSFIVAPEIVDGFVQKGKTSVEIVGGGRRLQALQLLYDRKFIPIDFPVPVLIRAEAEAIELSMSENLARRDMNPADEFTAFAALMKPGALAPADLAKRFGFTERYVQQRLRLASLSELVLDGLRAGEMTLDAALAYAGTQDAALQAKIYKAQCKANYDKHSPAGIRRDIINAQMTTGSPLFLFVGAKDYEAKGGAYEDDLFAAAESYSGRKVRDAKIVMDIAQFRAEFALKSMLKTAQRRHPTTCDILLVPGLRGNKMPKPPKGWKLVSPGWNYSWPSQAQLRDRAKELGAGITGIAALDYQGALKLEEAFFVPADRYDEIIPKKAEETSETQAERDARWAKEKRDKGIRLHAARMAANENALSKIDGRRFWQEQYHLENRMDPDLGMCIKLNMLVLVTEDEVDAKMEAAAADYDAELLREAENKAAQEEAEAEMEAALATRIADILAMDPPPQVVVLDRMAFYRWECGGYADEPDQAEGAEYWHDSLAAALEEAQDIGAAYATVADYEAAIALSNGDAPADAEPVS